MAVKARSCSARERPGREPGVEKIQNEPTTATTERFEAWTLPERLIAGMARSYGEKTLALQLPSDSGRGPSR
jgi:hypothetical protein